MKDIFFFVCEEKLDCFIIVYIFKNNNLKFFVNNVDVFK